MKISRWHAAWHRPGSALHWAVAVLAVGLSTGTGQAQGVDDCAAGPQAIAGDGLFAFDNTSATVDGAGNALCLDFGTDQFGADVWFCWTAACTGSVTIETCGLTGIDTRLAVYDGCSCTAPILACNDDICDRQSSITFNATGGNSYLLRVGTFPGSASGTGQFRVTAATTCNCLINADCDDGNICTRDACDNGTCTYIDSNGPCDDGLFCTSTDACLNGACVGSGDPCAGCGACDEVADACTTATVNPMFESLTSATTGDNNVQSLALGLPGGTTAGDLLIAVLSTDANESLSAPAGWTVIDSGTSSGTVTVGVWYRVAGPAEPASFAFTWTSNEEAVGAILRYSGVDPLNPIGAAASSTGTSNSPTAPSVTTTIDAATILRLYGADDDDLLATPYPAGHAGRFNIESSATGGSCSAGAADIVQATAGATGAAAFNLSASEQWRAVTVALRPPAAECTGAADCDDGIACTNDTCACGVCVFTPNDGACDDGNECTDDACSNGTCINAVNTDNCDDGDACTESDTCSDGACSGTPIDCADGNQCTDDACSNGICINAVNTNTCDDGDACTEFDTCSDGACSGTPIDCADGNECTDDACSNGICINAFNTNGCDDGDACTELDTCSDGACSGTPIDCADGNECTDDACSNGTCINAVNTNTCDDGDACTELDTCSDGACSGMPIDCADGNECTDDFCSNGICINAFNTNGCDDGDACTEFDACSDGACSGMPIDCADGNECTDDFCSNGICINAFNTNGCDDGDACTEFDACSDGACSGMPIDCADGNECTDDFCSNGICINAFNTNGCDDGDACTEFDACSDGACSGMPIDCADGNECTDDFCSNGTCINAFNTDNCDDGDACTEADSCSDGICKGELIGCGDGNPCTDDFCSNGACLSVINTNGCDDGNDCTEFDTCVNGVCAGSTVDCDDGDACTTDFCTNGTCLNEFNTNGCDDGNDCTEFDACSNGACAGAPIDCDDGDPCTNDGCAPGTGCVHDFNTTGCSDGLFCNGEESCDGAGTCSAGTPPCAAALCNESNDTCDPDCNSNGIPDADDLAGTSLDCNANQVPDECELADSDCDTNGVPDACDIAGGAPDGNANGRPDICDGPIRYVDDDAAPGGDGVSWATAYDDLQDALTEARGIGALIDEIRVGAGVYTPAGPSGDRNANFALIDDVALRGGYAGLGGPDPDERNFDLFNAVLSGDLNGDDVGGFGGTAGDNAFQVVTGSSTGPTALLEGFVIERGGQIDRFGGGLSNSEGSPTVRWCTFQDNVAFTGGAIFGSSSHPLIENCRFLRNFAQNDGGAIRNAGNGILRNCLFVANTCGRDGGAIYSLRGDFTIANCTVVGNVAGRFAGGLWLPNFGNEMYNCLSWYNADSTTDVESAQLKFSAEIGLISHCNVQGWTGTLGGTDSTGLDPLFVDADGMDNVFGTIDDDLTLLPGTPCANTGDFYFAGLSISDLDGEVRIQACRVDIGADETPFAGGVDCNLNLVDDACDIAEGELPDLNSNAIPDDCEDCALDAQCSDDIFCNGAELCLMGTCVPPAGDACLPNELCDETHDVCVAYGTGDFDDDGDLDLADFSAFQQCFGQSVFDVPTCPPGNLNGDEFVDAADFAALEGDLRGP